MEKATYSYSKVCKARALIKALNITCQRKQDHFAKACEFKEVADKCYELTGCLLFEYDCAYPIYEYMRAANRYKDYSNKELTQFAKRARNYLIMQIDGIRLLMESGDVNTVE